LREEKTTDGEATRWGEEGEFFSITKAMDGVERRRKSHGREGRM